MKYLREGATQVIENRREDAYEQGFSECDGKYVITREWDETDGVMTNGAANTWGNSTAFSTYSTGVT